MANQKRILCKDVRFTGKKFKPAQSSYTLSIRRIEGFDENEVVRRRLRMKRKEIKKRRSKAMYILIQSVMFAVMLVALGQIGENYQENVRGNEHRSDIEQFVLSETVEPYATPDRTAPAYPLETPERITYPAKELPTLGSLKWLQSLNKDFKFWLHIPDSEVSYYVMQGQDNDYYLHRSIYDKYLESGSCFLDYRCNADTMEGHTIIYGHTMNDLSVFGKLRGYLEKDFFDTHRYMYTASVDGVTMWRVYSVYITTTDEYYIETYFSNDAEYLAFIEALGAKSKFPTNTVLTPEDDILTLSTCYRPNGGAKGRLTVHAVKVGTAPIL